MLEPRKGSKVRFYDCHQAWIDKDHSGDNPKYYPVGEVVKVYDYTASFGYTDRVCDIKIGDRISKGHFARGVKIIEY